ncbi:MAG: YceI family protein [Bacteroidota bacterium]
MKNLTFSALTLFTFAIFAFTPATDKGKEKDKGKTQINAVISYKVDPKKSNIVWTGKKVTGEHQGTIAVSNGTLSAKDKTLTGGSFEFDVNSITVTDIKDQAQNAKLVGHLKNDDFFAAAKYPKANFIITSATPKGGNNYDIKGKLTIKGITNEVAFPAIVTSDANNLTAKAKITVDRTKYDIKFHSANFFENLGDKAIADNFDLDVTLVSAK